MKHTQKIKLSKQMGRTKDDVLYNHGVFDTDAWKRRKEQIQARVRRRVNRAQTRKAEREEAKKKGLPVEYSIK